MRKLLATLLLATSLTPALGQAPPAIPALPDTERRTSYLLTASTCACAVGFQLYGDGTDYANWVEVFVNGVRKDSTDPAYGWTITSPSGSLGSIARPVTNGVLTFGQAQTGTIQIVGARRPRRASQFPENRGVAARDLNQAITDLTATNREFWDKVNDVSGRGLFAPPGSVMGPLPAAASCVSSYLGFDSSGLNPVCLPATGGTAGITGPATTTPGTIPIWGDAFGRTLLNGSSATTRLLLSATTTAYANSSAVSSAPCGAFTCSPGSDGNDCLSPTTPCRTIQVAVNKIVGAYDFGDQTVNFQLADGTYNECVVLPQYVNSASNGRRVSIVGHAGSVGSVVVTCAAGRTFELVNVYGGWIFKDITVNASTVCIYIDYRSAAYWDGGTFNNCTNFQVQGVNTSAFFEPIGNYTISGSSQSHVQMTNGAQAVWQGVTATITGSPTFSNGLLASTKSGRIDEGSATFSGAFTGNKYNISGPAFQFSTGAAATTAGATQYIGLSSISNTENNYYPIPSAYSGLVNLYVQAAIAPGVGQTLTFTLRLGGGASTLTCTITGAATSCADGVHLGFGGSGLVQAGLAADLQVVSSAGAAATQVSAGVVGHN